MFYNLLYFYYLIHISQYKLILNLSFYIFMIIIFILGLDINLNLNNNISFNFLLINIFLSFIFSLENIFYKDLEEGALDLYFLINFPLEIFIIYKWLIHWIIYGLSLIFIIPFFNLLMNLDFDITYILYIILSTIYLNNIGFISSALIINIKQRIFLLYLINFPLFLPCIIFSLTIFKLEILFLIIIFSFLLFPLIIYTLRQNIY